jgi:hypothetical protein
VFLISLSCLPTYADARATLEHVSKAPAAEKRKAWEDVLWALINSKEFLFRH